MCDFGNSKFLRPLKFSPVNYLLVLVWFFHSDYKLTFKMKRDWDLLLGTARKGGPGEKASYSTGCLTKEKIPRNRDTGVRLHSRKTGWEKEVVLQTDLGHLL